MNKINSIILYTLLALIITYLVFDKFKKDKTVYVDNIELFTGFKMKTELEKKYKQVESIRKQILDSLYNEVRIKSQAKTVGEIEELNSLKRQFLIKKEAFDKENSETMSQYNREIWNQLNEYTKQFGDECHYDFILGATGEGALMYANDKKNVTKELLEFANSKYNGK